MTRKRKALTMSVTVTVPHWMTAAQARREVRSLINDQCGYMIDGGPQNDYADATVKARTVTPNRSA